MNLSHTTSACSCIFTTRNRTQSTRHFGYVMSRLMLPSSIAIADCDWDIFRCKKNIERTSSASNLILRHLLPRHNCPSIIIHAYGAQLWSPSSLQQKVGFERLPLPHPEHIRPYSSEHIPGLYISLFLLAFEKSKPTYV